MGLGKTSGGNPLGVSCSGWQARHLTCLLWMSRFLGFCPKRKGWIWKLPLSKLDPSFGWLSVWALAQMALLWVLCRPALMCCCVTVWLYSRTLASNYSSIHSFVHLVTNNPDVLPGRLFGVCCFWGWEQREQNGEPKKIGFGSGPEVSYKLSAFCVGVGHRHLLGWLWASAGGYCSYWSYPSLEIGSGAGVHHAEGFQWQCLRSSGGQLTFFRWRSFKLLWTVMASSILKPSILQTGGISLHTQDVLTQMRR